MSTALWTGLILLALGVCVWLFGNRMWLLGAGAGALLGYGLLRLFPGMADGTVGLLIVIGMAILLACWVSSVKPLPRSSPWSLVSLSAAVWRWVSSICSGVWASSIWILALVVAFVVALIFARFLDWGLIIFAALLGSC